MRQKVATRGSISTHLSPSMFKVMPHTLTLMLQAVWGQVISNVHRGVIDELDQDQTRDVFDMCIKEFIAAHAIHEDRHELLQQAAAKSFMMACLKPGRRVLQMLVNQLQPK